MSVHRWPPGFTKFAPQPLDGERVVSYGDRLLWHQLALQLNGQIGLMLTEDEFVETVCHFFPDAVKENVRRYRSYFNGKHESMGFRGQGVLPIPVEFA
jgi:hypothetical protein